MASNRVGPEPQPGDLIEISYLGYIYQHWGVYVGDGHIVHLTGVDGGSSGIYLLGSVSGLSTQAVVKKELVTKVAAGNKYQVNSKYDRRFPPLPLKDILARAEALVGQVMPYVLSQKNCEHFATQLRYGVAVSDQVEENAKLIYECAALFGVVALVLSFSLMYAMSRK